MKQWEIAQMKLILLNKLKYDDHNLQVIDLIFFKDDGNGKIKPWANYPGMKDY